ncbi:MAG: NERD domain-containing protein [Ruminococcus sp.]|nr:NERD domain-containing protein [Ruminococcus sp.]MBQ4535110.1 NERD domain-containing protein [Ruminococcus sp.]MBQ9078265.1 NERD domain-containing protein [Ruminococcus sp.]MBR6623002.1 NERD domain-containing protein [Ruminococcus sp.]
MEKNLKLFLIVLAAAVVLLIIWGIASYFSKGRRKGRSAEKKVSKTISKIGKKDNIRIINNVFLPLYNKTVEIDHLVFGRFGVLVVETKGISGVITGSGKKLVHKVGTNVHKLYNPQLQNKTHIDNVIHHLKKGGFSSTPVYGAVVFTDNELTFEGNLGLTLDQFKDMYENLEDNGCNQDVLYHYFQKLCVTNPIKKFFHKFNKKDWD